MNITAFNKNSILTTGIVSKFSNRKFNLNRFVQKPDSFERTLPVNFKGQSGHAEEYSSVVNSLDITCHKAQVSLNGQIASDGWAGKTADFVSGLWNSKNRAHLVQADIDAYASQVKDLKASIKERNFKSKFKEIFDTEYNHADIVNYEKKANAFKQAVTADCIAQITKKKLSKDLNLFKQTKGILKDNVEQRISYMAPVGSIPVYYVTTPKEDVLSGLENSLVEVVGSKEVLNKSLKQNGVDVEHISDDDKYKAYGVMAEYLIETSKATSEKCRDGKSLADMKKEYEDAYKTAYGTKNNIQERVDKYNRSQEIGAAVVKGVVRAGASAAITLAMPAAGFAKILSGAATTFAVKVAADSSDKATNEIDNSIDLDSKSVQKIIKNAAISAAENFATKGLSSIIPVVDTGNDFINEMLEQGKGVVVDTAIGMTGERLKQGKWLTNQIAPRMIISAIFRNLGADSELVDNLLKCTKGGINQAMKKTTRDYDIVDKFIKGTKAALDENYLKDRETFGELKLIADTNPDLYNQIMVDMLNEQAEELKKTEK